MLGGLSFFNIQLVLLTKFPREGKCVREKSTYLCEFSFSKNLQSLINIKNFTYQRCFILIPTTFLIVTTTVTKSSAPRQNHQITASPRSTGTNFITSENFNFHWARHSIKSLTHCYLQAL